MLPIYLPLEVVAAAASFAWLGYALWSGNGVPARGGSLDGPGPVIGGGMVFVNSGYTVDGGAPGNVVLAFAPD